MAEPVTVDAALDAISFGRFHVLLIVVGSILNATEAIEIYILSVLDPLLRCAWRISSVEAATLTSCVSAGMLIGGPVLGAVSDRFGRRATLMLTALATVYFGLLSGLAPTFWWLVVLRTILGFFLNGLLLVTTVYVSEFTPTRLRSVFLLTVFTVWPVGGLLLVGLAYGLLGAVGWRGFVAMTSLPLLLPLIALPFLPRSPRFLLARGRAREAELAVARICHLNRSPPFTGRLALPPGASDGGSLLQELRRLRLGRTLFLLCVLAFCQSFLYMGHVLLVVLLPRWPHRCLQDVHAFSQVSSDAGDDSCCQTASHEAMYATIALTSGGELLSIFFALPFMDRLGRRLTLGLNAVVAAVTVLLLGLCQPPWAAQLMMVASRALITAVTVVLLIYNVEVLPTSVRSAALGACQVFSFLGSMVTPFTSQLLVPDGRGLTAVAVYTAVALLVAVLAACLPLETAERRLADTAAESSEERGGWRRLGEVWRLTGKKGGGGNADYGAVKDE